MHEVEFINMNLTIEGYCVTDEEFIKIAQWCKGDIGRMYQPPSEENPNTNGAVYIQVDSDNLPTTPAHRAFIGDWILKNGNTFKVFKDDEYQKLVAVSQQIRFRRILQLVRSAMHEQKKICEGLSDGDPSLTAEIITNSILGLE